MYKTVEIQRSIVSTKQTGKDRHMNGMCFIWKAGKHCCLHSCLRDVLIAEGYHTSALGNLHSEQTVKVFQVS